MTASRLCVAVFFAASCSAEDQSITVSETNRRASSYPARVAGKPSPAIDLRLAARALTTDRYDVTLTARPRVDRRPVLLQVHLPEGAIVERGAARRWFASTKAGESLVARVRVRLPSGSDLFGSARVGAPAGGRSKVVHQRIGPARRPRMGVLPTVVLPSGDRVAEVRP